MGFTQSFTTLEVKAFIIKIIDDSIQFLRRYEVDDKDRDDLEQTIEIIKKATETLGQQK